MERVIVKKTLCFLRKNGLISNHQHGFLSGLSTTGNLLETLSDRTFTINIKKSIAVGYIDYKRAFDCVSLTKLLLKLRSYGISGNLLSWIENFLTDRYSLSDTTHLFNGVVQGPLLFVLFIKDIANLFNDRNCVC